MTTYCDLTIIGGGVGGLHAATLAKQAEPQSSVCLLEGKGATGGRLKGVTFDAAPETVADTGAWRIGNYEELWLDYAKERGIDIEPWDL